MPDQVLCRALPRAPTPRREVHEGCCVADMLRRHDLVLPGDNGHGGNISVLDVATVHRHPQKRTRISQ